ncbi:MAG: isochorismatase family cysteine hydrolase, partial [Chloroflexota bacterium]|nr:isochorismatase family cysteine hydrolase [Chloroflexota bacterium]
MANAVIVVDMQRGFLEEGHPLFCGEEAREIIPNVKKLLEKELEKDSALFFTADTHEPDDKEFEMFPPHCIKGTRGAEIIPGLADFAAKGTLLPKRRYSGFFETDLAERLAKLKPEKLIVCGVCTDICVMHTVADARNRDYAVEVPADCVASFDPEAHEFAMKHMEKVLGAKIV